MQILYAKKRYKEYLGERIKKGTYILMANYRSVNYLKRFPVEFVSSFEMFWGARRCVIYLTKKGMLKWLKENSANMRTIKQFVKLH